MGMKDIYQIAKERVNDVADIPLHTVMEELEIDLDEVVKLMDDIEEDEITVVIVCGGKRTLGEAFDNLRNAFMNAIHFDELITYEEELEYKERNIFSRTLVKVKEMKSQVLDRKPMLVRARTTC